MNGTGYLSKAVIRVIVDPFLEAFSMSALLYGLIELYTESVPNWWVSSFAAALR